MSVCGHVLMSIQRIVKPMTHLWKYLAAISIAFDSQLVTLFANIITFDPDRDMRQASMIKKQKWWTNIGNQRSWYLKFRHVDFLRSIVRKKWCLELLMVSICPLTEYLIFFSRISVSLISRISETRVPTSLPIGWSTQTTRKLLKW